MLIYRISHDAKPYSFHSRIYFLLFIHSLLFFVYFEVTSEVTKRKKQLWYYHNCLSIKWELTGSNRRPSACKGVKKNTQRFFVSKTKLGKI
jgi:hypothetical protein